MTSWYVLTGGPSSGKTTILHLLNAKGFHVVPEAARVLIEQEIAQGKSPAQTRKNEKRFQDKVLQIKIVTESTLHPTQTVFLDRGIPDTIAYYEFAGLPITKRLYGLMQQCSYKKIFFFEQIPFMKDVVRIENPAEAERISFLLKKLYTSLAFPFITVPPLPIEQRLQFVLQNL
jgi:predicted ATPase